MKSEIRSILSLIAVLGATICAVNVFAQDRVKITNGILEGVSDKSSGVRSFKGIPFGEPPLGDLRWKPPQPVKNWQGARKADKFGSAAAASPADALPGHAGLLCRFDWLQCSFEQRLSCAQLRASDWLKHPTCSPTLPRVDLERALAGTPVPLVARVGSAVVNAGDLLHLAPGDILLLSEPVEEPLRVSSPGSDLNLRALLGSTAGLAGQASARHRGFHCLPN